PLIDLVRNYRGNLLLAMGARFAENACFYVFTVFIYTYASEARGFARDTILVGVLLAAALQLVAIPGFAALSRTHGYAWGWRTGKGKEGPISCRRTHSSGGTEPGQRRGTGPECAGQRQQAERGDRQAAAGGVGHAGGGYADAQSRDGRTAARLPAEPPGRSLAADRQRPGAPRRPGFGRGNPGSRP